MGKLFRYGMAAVVFVMVGFYLTAIYAIRHPDSFLARYGLAAFQLGTDTVFQIGRTTFLEAGRIILKTSPDAGPDSQHADLCPPGDPRPIDEVAQAEPELLPPIDNGIIQAVREQLPPISFAADGEPPLADERATTPAPDDIRQPALMPESVTELAPECDEAEQKMLRCFDDDEDAPARMLRTDGTEPLINTDALFRFWLDLFRGVVEEMDGQEESEAMHEEEPPPCQEDPAYQYQYPGCPFTGKCPFLDAPGMRPNVPLHENKRKKAILDPGFDPNSLHVPERLKRLLPQAGSAEEEEGEPLPEPNVDTTEFRPSDAKPGEFDPQPM